MPLAAPQTCEAYQRAMLMLNMGLAVWDPEPLDDRYQITWGSVIYPTSSGRFKELLNVSQEHDHIPYKPDDYEKFEAPVLVGPTEAIRASMLSDKGVACNQYHADDGGNDILPVESSGGFESGCKSDAGSMLFIEPHAIMTHVQSKRRIITYMRKHAPHWLALANRRLGLNIKEKDLFFVSGMTITSEWPSTAFQDSVVCENILGVDYSPFRRPESWETDAASPGSSFGKSTQPATSKWPHDQCVFIHYFKMKTRFQWRRSVKAASGPIM